MYRTGQIIVRVIDERKSLKCESVPSEEVAVTEWKRGGWRSDWNLGIQSAVRCRFASREEKGMCERSWIERRNQEMHNKLI